jgi:hypothetical protein
MGLGLHQLLAVATLPREDERNGSESAEMGKDRSRLDAIAENGLF